MPRQKAPRPSCYDRHRRGTEVDHEEVEMAPPPGCSSPALSPPSGCSRALHSSSQSRPFHVFAPTCSARAISPRPHFGRRTTTPVARIHLQARAQNQRPRAPLLSLGSRAGTPASHIHHQDLIRIEPQKRSARSAQGMEASGTPAATPTEALPQAMPEPVAVPVTNKDGDRLAGLLLEPCSAGGASPAPLAILCHGFRSSKVSLHEEEAWEAVYDLRWFMLHRDLRSSLVSGTLCTLLRQLMVDERWLAHSIHALFAISLSCLLLPVPAQWDFRRRGHWSPTARGGLLPL